jgi:uncharacterized protein YegP (UPF0339 family)
MPQNSQSRKAAAPSFKQYREADGQFYFKLLDAKGQLLLQSTGFASPKEAAQTIASCKRRACRPGQRTQLTVIRQIRHETVLWPGPFRKATEADSLTYRPALGYDLDRLKTGKSPQHLQFESLALSPNPTIADML